MTTHRLVLIDSRIENPHAFTSFLPAHSRWRFVEKTQDGLRILLQTLGDQHPLAAIDIVCHGAPGALYLGATAITHGDLVARADDWAAVGGHLASEGGLYLYGCETGQGEAGRRFVDTLSELTGATVAANSMPTGHAALGGSWQLDVWQAHAGQARVAPLSMPAYGALLNEAPTFVRDGGKLVFGVPGTEARAIAVQPDGKILVAGHTGSNAFRLGLVMRYNADGSEDTTFGSDGGTYTAGSPSDFIENYVTSMVLQPDGKIVVAGYFRVSNDLGAGLFDFFVARLNPDGSRDMSFDGDGVATTDLATSTDQAQSVALQSDGKIVVGGSSLIVLPGEISAYFGLARYNIDGSLDTSFGDDGKVLQGYMVPPDANGVINQFFSNAWGEGVAVRPDGKIVVVGRTESIIGPGGGEFAVGLYEADGSPVGDVFGFHIDNERGAWGTSLLFMQFVTTLEQGYGVAVQPGDNKILIVGWTDSGDAMFVARLNADRSPDTSFGAGLAYVISDFLEGPNDVGRSITLQPDGKILIAGTSGNNFAVARFNSDGSADTSFSGDGRVVTDLGTDIAYDITVQANGGILVAGVGSGDFAVVRYHADGTLDSMFGGSTSTLGTVTYVEGAAPVVLDSEAAIYDADMAALNGGLGDYGGASVYINRTGGPSTDDLFSATGGVSFTNGRVTVGGADVGSYSNSDGALTMVLEGVVTQVQVNQLLAGIAYANSSAAPPPSVTIDWLFADGIFGDQGGNGALVGTATSTVTITPVNSAPMASNLSAAETYTPNTALDLTDIVVSDADSSTVTATLTLSNPAAGTLDTGTSGAVTSTYAAGTGVWTASGAIDDVNALLAGVSFTPTLNFNGSFTVATSVSDGVASAVNGSKTFTAAVVNGAPTATHLSAPESYTEDTPLDLTNIVTADADSSTLTVTLTLSNTAAGTLSTATSGTATSTYGAGTGIWSASGAIADVNALLAGLTFSPALNFNGNFTLATSVSDGEASALTGLKAFTGVAVNDDPTLINQSAPEIYTPNTPLDLTDIIVSDVDSSTVTAVLTLLNPAAGALSTPSSGSATSIYSNGIWVALGPVADVNAMLAAVVFTPAQEFTGPLTIDVRVNDGVGPFVSGSKSFTVAINDAPTASNLSAAEAYIEDTPLNLTDIVVTDSDSTNVTVTLTMSDPAAGSLSTGTSGTVTSTFSAGVWSASGEAADINTLLAGVTFDPAADFNGDFTLATSVSDGEALALTGTKPFIGIAVNDAPTASNLSAAQVYTEDTPLGLADIVVADVDSASLTVTMYMLNAGNFVISDAGSLSTGTSGAATSTFSSGTWTASGAVADLNALLANLTFNPAADYTGDFTVYAVVSDSAEPELEPDADAAVWGTKTFSGIAVNDAPTASNLSAAEAYTEETPLNLTDIVVADVDSANLTVKLTLSDTAAGSLSTGTSGAVTSTFSAGVWSASGAVADINALLAGVTFDPAANFNGEFTLATSVSDGEAAAVTGSKAFTGAAVNDAPTARNLSAPEAYTEDTPLALTDIVVADTDSATLTVSLTLSNTAAGTLSTGTSGAVTSTFAAGVWTASGAAADINALLAGVTFNPAANFNGNFTLATRVGDGETPAVTGSKFFTGTAVNDAPTGTVNITGSAALGQVLTANAAALADVEGLGVLHYQWLRGGVAIAGAADAPTYTTTLGDVGASLSVRVSYTDGAGTVESATSASTAAVGISLAPPAGLSVVNTPFFALGNNSSQLLLGGAGFDILLGLGGNDWLDGGAGANTLFGGTGNDTYVVNTTGDQVIEFAGEGTADTVISRIFSYTLGANVEQLFLAGPGGLTGNGNTLANLIVGGAGNDRINGMAGNDTLIGGGGLDTFVFSTAAGAGNRDAIQNFVVADDTIQLNRTVYSALGQGPLAAGAFVTGTAALDANDRVIYNSATGALLYDADGSGFIAAVQFATLVGVAGVLSAADFVVV